MSPLLHPPFASQHLSCAKQALSPHIWQLCLMQSGLKIPHAAQAAPPLPQLSLVFPGMQVVPSQHPLAQVTESQLVPWHALLTHVSAKEVQFWHAAPPLPHWVFESPGWHVLSGRQQPLGQVVELHTGGGT